VVHSSHSSSRSSSSSSNSSNFLHWRLVVSEHFLPPSQSGAVDGAACFGADVQPDAAVGALISDELGPDAPVSAVADATSVDGVAAPTTAADDEAWFDGGAVVVTAVIGVDGMYSVDAAAAEATEAELAGHLAM